MTLTASEEELRQRYLADFISMATPAQRLLLLFDALLQDLSAAAQAFGGGDLKVVNDRLVHAQHILFALRDPLDQTSELGASLASLYTFCLGQLIRCNLEKDESLLAAVEQIIGRVSAANRQAASAGAAACTGLDARG